MNRPKSMFRDRKHKPREPRKVADQIDAEKSDFVRRFNTHRASYVNVNRPHDPRPDLPADNTIRSFSTRREILDEIKKQIFDPENYPPDASAEELPRLSRLSIKVEGPVVIVDPDQTEITPGQISVIRRATRGDHAQG